MFNLLEGVVPYKKEDIVIYNTLRWWSGLTLGDILDRAADIHPEKEAFVDQYTRLTFEQARGTTNRLAIGLLGIGIKPLDRILVQLPNWNEFVFAYFALQKIGAIPVLLIDRYRQHEIGRLVKLTGATGWIVASRYKKTDYIPIIKDVVKESPKLEKIITVRGEEDPFFSLEKLIAGVIPDQTCRDRLAALRPDPMQVCHMGPTGGTTGDPKIVPRTHNSLITGSEYCSKSWDQHSQDVNLLAGPIGHDLTFSKGFLGNIITLGKIVFLDSTSEADICRTIEKEKVTSVIWVPALSQRLLEYQDRKSYDLTSLRKMHSAGAASNPQLVRNVVRELNMTFYNGYGATEGMTAITRTFDDIETICSTVGRQTCPYDTYQLIDIKGNPVPQGTEGELTLKGPGVFTGYYNNPDENKKVFTTTGFFRTGDLAKIDSRGYISITGRIKEMINRGGESISTREIEELISQHPGVAAVGVVPMPDPLLGEKACAYIQPKEKANLDFEEIISFLKSKKASVLHLPERIEFIDAMPYTAAQKLDKKALRKDIERKIQQNS
jgi:2,3-dihydroxybenzoate-AMP ligase/mycobactin salicyl-AMP ligase